MVTAVPEHLFAGTVQYHGARREGLPVLEAAVGQGGSGFGGEGGRLDRCLCAGYGLIFVGGTRGEAGYLGREVRTREGGGYRSPAFAACLPVLEGKRFGGSLHQRAPQGSPVGPDAGAFGLFGHDDGIRHGNRQRGGVVFTALVYGLDGKGIFIAGERIDEAPGEGNLGVG